MYVEYIKEEVQPRGRNTNLQRERKKNGIKKYMFYCSIFFPPSLRDDPKPTELPGAGRCDPLPSKPIYTHTLTHIHFTPTNPLPQYTATPISTSHTTVTPQHIPTTLSEPNLNSRPTHTHTRIHTHTLTLTRAPSSGNAFCTSFGFSHGKYFSVFITFFFFFGFRFFVSYFFYKRIYI